MKSERLYYTDSYGRTFDATVVDRNADGTRIYLDRTLFYPTSGGQPNDLGKLAGLPVVDVIDEGERIAHILAAGLATGAEQVHGEIDWARRFDHMQQHTGQHLLSAVMAELFGYATLSFHMGDAISTVELDSGALTESQIAAAELRAMELIGDARPVQMRFEEAGSAANLRKASQRQGELRIIEIDGVDRSACGGTHVRTTAQLGLMTVRGQDKVRGHVRLEFVCGGRALRQCRNDYHLLARLVRESGCAPSMLPNWVAAQKQRIAEAEKERSRLRTELATKRAEELFRNTRVNQDGMKLAAYHVALLDDAAKAFANAFTSQPRAALLLVGQEPAGLLLAVSKDAGWHAGKLLKQALERYGGRGGGSEWIAQGSLPLESLPAVAKVLGFELESSEQQPNSQQR